MLHIGVLPDSRQSKPLHNISIRCPALLFFLFLKIFLAMKLGARREVKLLHLIYDPWFFNMVLCPVRRVFDKEMGQGKFRQVKHSTADCGARPSDLNPFVRILIQAASLLAPLTSPRGDQK